jgi:hypothetical protein
MKSDQFLLDAKNFILFLPARRNISLNDKVQIPVARREREVNNGSARTHCSPQDSHLLRTRMSKEKPCY